MTDLAEIFGDVIHAYSRAQAIEDGVLVDLTRWASSSPGGFLGGFKVPVAVTNAVWDGINAIPPKWVGIQDIRGRAHDVLWMASLAARRARPGDSVVRFKVRMDVRGVRRVWQTYKMVSGPGDEGEHVVTIMLPDED